MTRLLGLLLLVLLLAVPIGVSATHGNGGGGPSQDSVTGSANKFLLVDAHVRVEAHSGPAGEDPRGHFYLEQDPTSFGGRVTCLNVNGNTATLGGIVERNRSDLPFPAVGTTFLHHIVDNGEPGDMDTSYTFIGPPPALFNTCTLPPGGFVVEQGNYVVHDATP
jgi:hypothetical protein